MLVVNDERVINFYKTHSFIDFETANVLLVEMLERILQKNNDNRDDILLSYIKKIDSNFGMLNNNLSDVREDVKQSSQSIVNLQTTLSTIPSNLTDNLSSKLNTFRENQVKELERILVSNNHNNADAFDKKLKTELVEQIRSLFDNNMNNKIEKSLTQFEKTFRDDFKSYLKEIERSDSPQSILDSFNSNLQIKCDSLQQFIQRCHEQIDKTTNSHTETLNLVQTHFDRQKNSTFKGKDSEIKLEEGLNASFPDCQITNTTGIAKAGDFLIERNNKQSIMIENKDYKANVPKDEIEKFIRDVEEQNVNGILISQKSGICRKKNFQIDIHNGKIIVFIHHLDYNFDNIRLAVEVIDNLSNSLKDYGQDSVDIKLPLDIVKKINEEYLNFITQNNEMQFPELSNILSQHFTSTEQSLYKCEYCNSRVFKSKKALTKHIQTCKDNTNVKKPASKKGKSDVIIDIEIDKDDSDQDTDE
jgi:hypothetical protein